MLIVFILAIALISIWFYGFLQANDFSVPLESPLKAGRVLVLFPHPDDETLSAGGLISILTDHGSTVDVVVLTRGEKGNDDAHRDNGLKKIRRKELEKAVSILGTPRFTLEDFGDGELTGKKKSLRRYIDRTIQKIQPDLIITYDLSGLYGHEDHIVTSELITDLVLTKYKHISLWYPSFPEKIISMIALPEHMAKNPAYKQRRVTPNVRVLIGKNITRRIRALYAYVSQLYSFKKSFPVRILPLWFYYSMQIFEYYHKAN